MLRSQLLRHVFRPAAAARMIRTSAVRFSDAEGTVVHSDSEANHEMHSFDFTADNMKRVDIIIAKYPQNYKQSAVMPLLDLAQRQNSNFLTLAAIQKVAQILEMDPLHVYEVATFYSMFNRKPVGKYFIQLCGTTPCMVCGSNEIKRTILKHLGIKEGEVSKDGLFSLLEVECLGACANAPMVQINDDFYECLTPATTVELLEALKSGQPPKLKKWGSLPMNGQLSCEGPLGKTTLTEAPPAPFCRELPKLRDPAEIAREMNYEQ